MSDTYSPVPALNSLMELQRKLDGEYYADGFELTPEFGDDLGLRHGWSSDPEFLAALTTFALANGSGSEYALWKVDGRSDLAESPVVVFGDEGGAHVVARNLRELFQIIGFDVEPMIDWDGVDFIRDDDHEPSDRLPEYLRWLDANFGLSATEDPDALVAAAQAEFGEQFAAWAEPFLD